MLGSLMGAFSALQNAPPVVQKLVESIVAQVSEHPDIIADVSNAIEKLAAAKQMDIPTLLSSGGLARALVERASGQPITPERKAVTLDAVQCKHCGNVNYLLEKSYVRQEPSDQNR